MMSYDSWGNSWGTSSAWRVSWYHATTIDTHDGFDGNKKQHEGKRKAKERLHNQLEEAFRSAFEKAPPKKAILHDDPLERFVFPPYVEIPKTDDDEEAELLLLST